MTTDGFVCKAIHIHGDTYGYKKVDYQGVYKKVIIHCPLHGDFLQKPSNHLTGSGCPKCASEQRVAKTRKTNETFTL